MFLLLGNWVTHWLTTSVVVISLMMTNGFGGEFHLHKFFLDFGNLE